MFDTKTNFTQDDMAEIVNITARAQQAINQNIERELREMNKEIARYISKKLRGIIDNTDEQRMRHKLKFGPLFAFFKSRTEKELTLTFDQIGEIIGKPLSASAYKFREYWMRYGRSRLADCWYANGYKIKILDLDKQFVSFYQINPFGSIMQSEDDALE